MARVKTPHVGSSGKWISRERAHRDHGLGYKVLDSFARNKLVRTRQLPGFAIQFDDESIKELLARSVNEPVGLEA